MRIEIEPNRENPEPFQPYRNLLKYFVLFPYPFWILSVRYTCKCGLVAPADLPWPLALALPLPSSGDRGWGHVGRVWGGQHLLHPLTQQRLRILIWKKCTKQSMKDYSTNFSHLMIGWDRYTVYRVNFALVLFSPFSPSGLRANLKLGQLNYL